MGAVFDNCNRIYGFLSADFPEFRYTPELKKLSLKCKYIIDQNEMVDFLKYQNAIPKLKNKISKISEAENLLSVNDKTRKFIQDLLICLRKIDETTEKDIQFNFESLDDVKQKIVSPGDYDAFFLQAFVGKLFEEKEGGRSLFSELIKSEEGNQIFDQLMKLIGENGIAINNTLQTIIHNFAFTVERFDYLFLNKNQVNPELLSILTECQEKCTYDQAKLIEKKNYLKKHAAVSNTVKDKNAFQDWKETYAYIEKKAKSKESISWSDVIEINKMLTKSMPTSLEIVDLVVTGGSGPLDMFCPLSFQKIHIEEFDRWLKNALFECDNKELHPILLAAQAYQRIVSLHPFHDGNGRTGRLIMDLILVRHNIIPPNLSDENVRTGIVFSLNPSKRSTPESFLSMVVKKIYETMQECYVRE